MVARSLKDIIISQLVYYCYFIFKCIISLWKKITVKFKFKEGCK